MALSDNLTELAARAKKAEEHAAAAREHSKTELEGDVASARASAQAQGDKLRESAEANKNKLSAWWHELQHTWSEHMKKIRHDIDAKKAEHDADHAQHRAERRAVDAAYSIEFALAAIEEAEYSVLDAELARIEADEQAAA